MDALGGDPPGRKVADEIIDKARRPAEIKVGIARHAQASQHVDAEASGSVEIDGRTVLGTRRTVTNVAVAVGESFEEGSRLNGKRVLAAVAGSVNPPNLPRRLGGGQCMEHRKHGGRADTSTQQNDGAVAGPEGEIAAIVYLT